MSLANEVNDLLNPLRQHGIEFEYDVPEYRQVYCPMCMRGYDSHKYMNDKCPKCSGKMKPISSIEFDKMRKDKKEK